MSTESWSDWLVRADELTELGDPRGELLLVEHELGDDPDVALFLLDYLDKKLVSEADEARLRWDIRTKERLRPLLTLAPDPLRLALSKPLSQVVSMATLGRGSPALWTTTEVREHHQALVAGMITWIDRAFDGVPAPDEEHRTLEQAEAADDYSGCERRAPLGRWQDLPDDYLLANQWAIPHLDSQGVHHYFPAVMAFQLRRALEPHPRDHWITESLNFALVRSGRTVDAYTRERFAVFTQEQRRAVAAFTTCYEEDAYQRWLAASLVEGPEWIELLAGGR